MLDDIEMEGPLLVYRVTAGEVLQAAKFLHDQLEL